MHFALQPFFCDHMRDSGEVNYKPCDNAIIIIIIIIIIRNDKDTR